MSFLVLVVSSEYVHQSVLGCLLVQFVARFSCESFFSFIQRLDSIQRFVFVSGGWLS